MTSEQIAEWMAYYNLEPFGNRNRDLHLAIIAATVANFAPFVKKDKVLSPEQFMVRPYTPKKVKEASTEDIKAIFQAVAQIKRKKDKDDE